MKRIWEKLLCGVMATGAIVCGADLELPGENLGIKNPGDVVEVEAVVKDMRTAEVINSGGWPWNGGMTKETDKETDKAKFATKVPKKFKGKHDSTFGGEYGAAGQSGGKVLTWEKRAIAYSDNGQWVTLMKGCEITNTDELWRYQLDVNYGKWNTKPSFSLKANFKSGEPIDYPDVSNHVFPGLIQIHKKSGAGFLVSPSSKQRKLTFVIQAKGDGTTKSGSINIVVNNKEPDLTIKSVNDKGNFAQKEEWQDTCTVELDTIEFSDLESKDDPKNGGMLVAPPPGAVVKLSSVSTANFTSVKISNGKINGFKNAKRGRNNQWYPGPEGGFSVTSGNYVELIAKFNEATKDSWRVFANMRNIGYLLENKGSVRIQYNLVKKTLERVQDKAENPATIKGGKLTREFWILRNHVALEFVKPEVEKREGAK